MKKRIPGWMSAIIVVGALFYLFVVTNDFGVPIAIALVAGWGADAWQWTNKK